MPMHLDFVPCDCVCAKWTDANWRQSVSINQKQSRELIFPSFVEIFKKNSKTHVKRARCVSDAVIEVLQLQVKVINNSLPAHVYGLCGVSQNARRTFYDLTLFPTRLRNRFLSVEGGTRTNDKQKKNVKRRRRHVTNINNSSLKIENVSFISHSVRSPFVLRLTNL